MAFAAGLQHPEPVVPRRLRIMELLEQRQSTLKTLSEA
jgi:hypothetical protein